MALRSQVWVGFVSSRYSGVVRRRCRDIGLMQVVGAAWLSRDPPFGAELYDCCRSAFLPFSLFQFL